MALATRTFPGRPVQSACRSALGGARFYRCAARSAARRRVRGGTRNEFSGCPEGSLCILQSGDPGARCWRNGQAGLSSEARRNPRYVSADRTCRGHGFVRGRLGCLRNPTSPFEGWRSHRWATRTVVKGRQDGTGESAPAGQHRRQYQPRGLAGPRPEPRPWARSSGLAGGLRVRSRIRAASDRRTELLGGRHVQLPDRTGNRRDPRGPQAGSGVPGRRGHLSRRAGRQDHPGSGQQAFRAGGGQVDRGRAAHGRDQRQPQSAPFHGAGYPGAGGEPAQDAGGDGRRRSRRPDQAGRAHLRHSRGEERRRGKAPPRRPGSLRYLRAAGPPPGHRAYQVGAGGPVLPLPRARPVQADRQAAARAPAGSRAVHRQRDEPVEGSSRPPAYRPISADGRNTSIRSGARCSARAWTSARSTTFAPCACSFRRCATATPRWASCIPSGGTFPRNSTTTSPTPRKTAIARCIPQ